MAATLTCVNNSGANRVTVMDGSRKVFTTVCQWKPNDKGKPSNQRNQKNNHDSSAEACSVTVLAPLVERAFELRESGTEGYSFAKLPDGTPDYTHVLVDLSHLCGHMGEPVDAQMAIAFRLVAKMTSVPHKLSKPELYPELPAILLVMHKMGHQMPFISDTSTTKIVDRGVEHQAAISPQIFGMVLTIATDHDNFAATLLKNFFIHQNQVAETVEELRRLISAQVNSTLVSPLGRARSATGYTAPLTAPTAALPVGDKQRSRPAGSTARRRREAGRG